MSELVEQKPRPVRRRSNQYVMSEVSGQALAIPVEDVRDVVSLETLTGVPTARSAVAGLTSVAGDLATVVDLSALVGKPAKPRPGEAILGLAVEHDGGMFVVLVDRVADVRTVSSDLLKAGAALASSGPFADMAEACFEEEGERVLVLDIARTLDPDRLAQSPARRNGGLDYGLPQLGPPDEAPALPPSSPMLGSEVGPGVADDADDEDDVRVNFASSGVEYGRSDGDDEDEDDPIFGDDKPVVPAAAGMAAEDVFSGLPSLADLDDEDDDEIGVGVGVDEDDDHDDYEPVSLAATPLGSGGGWSQPSGSAVPAASSVFDFDDDEKAETGAGIDIEDDDADADTDTDTDSGTKAEDEDGIEFLDPDSGETYTAEADETEALEPKLDHVMKAFESLGDEPEEQDHGPSEDDLDFEFVEDDDEDGDDDRFPSVLSSSDEPGEDSFRIDFDDPDESEDPDAPEPTLVGDDALELQLLPDEDVDDVDDVGPIAPPARGSRQPSGLPRFSSEPSVLPGTGRADHKDKAKDNRPLAPSDPSGIFGNHDDDESEDWQPGPSSSSFDGGSDGPRVIAPERVRGSKAYEARRAAVNRGETSFPFTPPDGRERDGSELRISQPVKSDSPTLLDRVGGLISPHRVVRLEC